MVWLVWGVVACVPPLVLPPAGRALIHISGDVDGAIGAIVPGPAGFWVLAAGLLVVASVERRGEFAVGVIVVSAVTVGVSLYDVTNPVRWPLLTGLGAAGDVTTIGVALMTAGIFVWLIERRSGSMADRVGLGLDETVHQRTRLAIVATLTEVSKVDFASLRDGLGLTDGNLARHLQVLEEAGFVGLTKEFHGARVRTWVEMTRAGRDAYDEEIRQLRALVTCADERSAAIRPGESARAPRLATHRVTLLGMVRKKTRRVAAPSRSPVPVTVLHGFLGSGKTTLLQSLLAQAWSSEPRLHVAVVVNDLSELDVDGVLLEETDVVGPRDATLVSITGGSIHSVELLPALDRACATVLAARRPDHLFIETSGSTRPGPVVDFLRRHPGLELHGLLTLVDAAMLRDDLDLGRGVLAGLRRHLAAGTQGFESLLAEQLMFATDVYLSKVDKLTQSQVRQVASAIHPLNPRAGVTAVRYGNLALATVLAQPRYDHHRVDRLRREIERRDVDQPQGAHVASLVLDDPRPFHPQRLWDAFTQAMPQQLYRSKGFTWLPTRDDQVLVWNQAAGGIGLEVLGYWKAGILGHADSTLLPEEVAGLQAVVAQGDPVFGDRRTQLTLLGPEAPTRAFLALLRTCLCTDDEVCAWQAGEPFDDPWPTRRATLTAPGL